MRGSGMGIGSLSDVRFQDIRAAAAAWAGERKLLKAPHEVAAAVTALPAYPVEILGMGEWLSRHGMRAGVRAVTSRNPITQTHGFASQAPGLMDSNSVMKECRGQDECRTAGNPDFSR